MKTMKVNGKRKISIQSRIDIENKLLILIKKIPASLFQEYFESNLNKLIYECKYQDDRYGRNLCQS